MMTWNARKHRSRLHKLLFLIATSLIISMLMPATVHAIDWTKLEPQEVIEQADLIVQGRYRFDQEVEHQNTWHFYPFESAQVISGTPPSNWLAGIEASDRGRARKHQEQGGQFILFLESESGGRYIPVAGPNGMVDILNGKIINMDQSDMQVYTEYIHSLDKTISSQEPYRISYKSEDRKISTAGVMVAMTIIVFAAFAVVALMLILREKPPSIES